MTRPRNERGHPPWCRKDQDIGSGTRHVSTEVRAGARRNGGEVAVWLIADTTGLPQIRVVVAHMATASADISLHAAAELRDGLTRLLKAAGHE